MFFRVVVSIASAVLFPAAAEEGFYKPGQLKTAFSQAETGRAVWSLKLPHGGKGTAFFVSPEGHFFTTLNLLEYELGHLVQMRKLNLANGHSGKPLRVQIEGLKLSHDVLGTTLTFSEFELVSLPPQSWSWAISPSHATKRDFVLCRLNLKPAHWLRLASQPTRKGDVVYALGFPEAMSRLSSALRDGVYPDTDGTLRLSKGIVQGSASYLWSDRFLSDVDAFHGSVGGPTVNENGEVVGMIVGPASAQKFDRVHYSGHARVTHIHARELAHWLDLGAVDESCARRMSLER